MNTFFPVVIVFIISFLGVLLLFKLGDALTKGIQPKQIEAFNSSPGAGITNREPISRTIPKLGCSGCFVAYLGISILTIIGSSVVNKFAEWLSPPQISSRKVQPLPSLPQVYINQPQPSDKTQNKDTEYDVAKKVSQVLFSADENGDLFQEVKIEAGSILVVVVKNKFLYQPYQVRLQVAQSVRKLVRSRGGDGIFRINDIMGNTVAGGGLTGAWANK